MLIVFSGLPGSGKSSIARELAKKTGAFLLRIDWIEQAIKESGISQVNEAGYLVAYALAEENLRLGRDVIGDSVNGLSLTREAWLEVSMRAEADIIEVEIICSDLDEHQRRVETRVGDIQGHLPPKWQDVNGRIRREYEPWEGAVPLTIDTAMLAHSLKAKDGPATPRNWPASTPNNKTCTNGFCRCATKFSSIPIVRISVLGLGIGTDSEQP